MIVLVLTAAPDGLRGHVTRWLVEIAPGTYIGKVPARVRENLWEIVVSMIGKGRAIMVHTARNEQGYAFKVHGHDWQPVELDGLTLMLRPGPQNKPPYERGAAQPLAKKYRQARRFG